MAIHTNQPTMEIYEILKERIQNGDYVPGQKINQTELSKEFHVSRTPITKALGMLQAEELVDNVPQRGYFIHTLTVKDVLEMYQLRSMMDCFIAKDVIRNITDEEIDELEGLFLPFKDREKIDVAEYARADMKFHSRLYELSNNSTFIKFYRHLGISYRHYIAGVALEPHQTLNGHFEIINALRARDSQLATDLMSQHVNVVKEKIERLYESLVAIGRKPEIISIGEFQL